MALTFDDDQAGKLLELLGLPGDTMDVDTILATVEDAVKQAGEQKPSDVAASAKRLGLEVLDNDTIEALRRDAAEGRQIKAAAEAQRIAAAVGTAISKGKITVARREHWVKLITHDPAMADVLASVPDETAVPLTEIGHGVDSEGPQGADADAWFR